MIKINNTYYENNNSYNLLYNNSHPISIILTDTSYIDIDEDYSIENISNFFTNDYKCSLFPFHYYIRSNGEIFKGRDEGISVPYIDGYINEEGNFIPNGIFNSIYNINDNIVFEDSLECKEEYSGNNNGKIFICLEGNFDKDLPTNSQYLGLLNLCDYLKDKYKIVNIFGMNEFYKDFNTPGIFFKINEIRSKFKNEVTKDYYTVPNGNIVYTLSKRDLYYDENNIIYGNDVKLLQAYLNKIGLLNEKYINGLFDYHTYEVICMIQKDLSYEEDNINGVMDGNIYKYISDKINNINNENFMNNTYHRILSYNPDNMIYGNDVAEINNKLYLFNFNKNNEKIINENLTNENKYYFTKDSELAVKEFQKLFNFNPDGIVGPILFNNIMNYKVVKWNLDKFETINKNSDPSVYGDIIKVIQKELSRIARTRNIHLSDITINGIYDNNTENNISILQMILGLEQTGEVDEELFDILKTF